MPAYSVAESRRLGYTRRLYEAAQNQASISNSVMRRLYEAAQARPSWPLAPQEGHARGPRDILSLRSGCGNSAQALLPSCPSCHVAVPSFCEYSVAEHIAYIRWRI